MESQLRASPTPCGSQDDLDPDPDIQLNLDQGFKKNRYDTQNLVEGAALPEIVPMKTMIID